MSARSQHSFLQAGARRCCRRPAFCRVRSKLVRNTAGAVDATLLPSASVRKAQNKHFAFWRKDSHPIEPWGGTVVEQKTQYIHANPVEAGIVTEAHHYSLCTWHQRAR